MSLSSAGFGQNQTPLLLFSGVALAIKFLDITKFGFIELGDNSDKNLAVGAISLVVFVFFLACLASAIHEYIEKHIDDGRIGSPTVPDFTSEANYISPYIVTAKFLTGYFLFFILKIFPLIIGLLTLTLTRLDILYLFKRTWGLLISGGQP